MNPTDDDVAERARLERIAWGAGSSPAEAARARIALADLPRRRVRSARPTSDPTPVAPVAPGSASGGAAAATAHRTTEPAPSVPSPPGSSSPGRPDGTRRRSGDRRRIGGDDEAVDAGERTGRAGGPDAVRPVLSEVSDGDTVSPAAPGAIVHGADGREAAHRSGTAGRPAEHLVGAAATADGEPAVGDPAWAGPDRVDANRSGPDRVDAAADAGAAGTDASTPAGRVSGLLAGVRRLVARVRRADRTALWVAAGVAVVVGLALGTGAGVAVGTGRSAQPGTAVVTPAAGTVTVGQLLAAPQTYADQLPGAVDAPVMLRSTRLVFTNRSLSGDDAATPWAVWAGVGRDGKMICLVASADRLEGSSACYPREDALHGTVSMTAMSSSGTLWVSLKGGAVLATVTGSY